MPKHSAVVFASLLLVGSQPARAESPDFVAWKYETGGKVLAHPATDDQRVYIGSDDGKLYALDTASGSPIWSYEAAVPIRTQATLSDESVFLVAGSDLIALDRATGAERWRSTVGPPSDGQPIDPWDYHGARPLVHGSEVIVGLTNGLVAGLGRATGELAWSIEGEAAVRGGLWVDGATLYFGDWNGVVHAYDLRTRERRWTHETFRERPYGSFGALNSTMTTAGDRLFFGARNDTLHVLHKSTGELLWTHEEEDGGWLSGDPLVIGNTLYLGGSDNHEMQAFDVASGALLWTFTFLNNCFSQPLAYRDLLLFTTGDAYNVYGDKPGVGYLYAVRQDDGELVNFTRLGGNLYTTLALVGDTLVAGSEDGHVYGISMSRFLDGPARLQEKGYGVLEIWEIEPNPFERSTTIALDIAHAAHVRVWVTTVNEEPVAEIASRDYEPGAHQLVWDGTDAAGKPVAPGYYFVVSEVGETVLKRFVQKASGTEEP